ncbi:MAG: ADP-ribosylglycohydrolase family protein [Ardenticatenaceae bacterium]|nr:ADP-ribosylglycohydrolase family protein [Ardenticatenaceae bacterium]
MYSSYELLLAELDLREQQGVDGVVLAGIRTAVSHTPDADLTAHWQQLEMLKPAPGWPYYEPISLADIQATLPPAAQLAEAQDVAQRVHGGVLGRCAGMMLGKPLEGTNPPAQIWAYLRRAGAYPLRDYVPLLEPLPDDIAVPAWSRWHDTTLGNIGGTVRDDDIDYMIAALLILQRYGFEFTPADVGQFWLNHFAYEQVYTAERVLYRHLVNGVDVATAVTLQNPYREWIGAQIRADVYGYVWPGQPRRAAALAYQDASLSHVQNGVYGAMWVAAMVAAAFVLDDVEAIVRAGLAEIPPQSRLAEAIGDVLVWVEEEVSWEGVWQRIEGKYGRYYKTDEGTNWVHTIPNACLVALGLLYGKGDFGVSVGTAVMGGWDTDCNGATVGSILGVMLGVEGIPARWAEPLDDKIESSISGYNRLTISGLAQEIAALVKR